MANDDDDRPEFKLAPPTPIDMLPLGTDVDIFKGDRKVRVTYLASPAEALRRAGEDYAAGKIVVPPKRSSENTNSDTSVPAHDDGRSVFGRERESEREESLDSRGSSRVGTDNERDVGSHDDAALRGPTSWSGFGTFLGILLFGALVVVGYYNVHGRLPLLPKTLQPASSRSSGGTPQQTQRPSLPVVRPATSKPRSGAHQTNQPTAERSDLAAGSNEPPKAEQRQKRVVGVVRSAEWRKCDHSEPLRTLCSECLAGSKVSCCAMATALESGASTRRGDPCSKDDIAYFGLSLSGQYVNDVSPTSDVVLQQFHVRPEGCSQKLMDTIQSVPSPECLVYE